MPNRKFKAADGYRYGFNGKENDSEVKGEGNSLDFGARILDPRLGRWLSVDPLQQKYTDLSPYNYVANSPINALDPDGKLIIFINGLWGPPMKVGTPGPDYWGTYKDKLWTEAAQDAIGDHKEPMFFDGSFGGTARLPANMSAQSRIDIGGNTGHIYAQSIIDKLDKGETIKIITNSMGAAFERGFTQGLLTYRDERLDKVNSELIISTLQQSKLEKVIGEKNLLGLGTVREPETRAQKKYIGLLSKIAQLKSEKEKLENLTIEMVVDLSSHQIDYSDPNAKASYYMTADENVAEDEKLWGFGVQEKHIKGAKSLGKMSVHHSTGAEPTKLPSAEKRDDKK